MSVFIIRSLVIAEKGVAFSLRMSLFVLRFDIFVALKILNIGINSEKETKLNCSRPVFGQDKDIKIGSVCFDGTLTHMDCKVLSFSLSYSIRRARGIDTGLAASKFQNFLGHVT